MAPLHVSLAWGLRLQPSLAMAVGYAAFQRRRLKLLRHPAPPWEGLLRSDCKTVRQRHHRGHRPALPQQGTRLQQRWLLQAALPATWQPLCAMGGTSEHGNSSQPLQLLCPPLPWHASAKTVDRQVYPARQGQEKAQARCCTVPYLAEAPQETGAATKWQGTLCLLLHLRPAYMPRWRSPLHRRTALFQPPPRRIRASARPGWRRAPRSRQ